MAGDALVNCRNCQRRVVNYADNCPGCGWLVQPCKACGKPRDPGQALLWGGNHHECMQRVFRPQPWMLKCETCGTALTLSWFEQYFGLDIEKAFGGDGMNQRCPSCSARNPSEWTALSTYECNKCHMPVFKFQAPGGGREHDFCRMYYYATAAAPALAPAPQQPAPLVRDKSPVYNLSRWLGQALTRKSNPPRKR